MSHGLNQNIFRWSGSLMCSSTFSANHPRNTFPALSIKAEVKALCFYLWNKPWLEETRDKDSGTEYVVLMPQEWLGLIALRPASRAMAKMVQGSDDSAGCSSTSAIFTPPPEAGHKF